MDALALLCNLHADGPLTLQRLRRSGCASLEALLELPPVQLSTHLDGSARTAERFLREAHLLTERLEIDENVVAPAAHAPPAPVEEVSLEEVLEEDELDEDELVEEAEVEEAYGYDEDEEELAEESAELEEGEGEGEDEGEDEEVAVLDEDEEEPDEVDLAAEQEMQNVIATWTEADRDAPPDDPDDFVMPRPEPSVPANQALEELDLEGVGLELRERLVAAGIPSLRGLIDASPLELARSLELPFTRVKHIQFLARRAWNTRPEPAQAPRSYDELVAIERLDASGPFAGEPGLPAD